MYLDGELYNHALKDDFEKLMSAVRKQKPSEESLQVQYHIYDCIIEEECLFAERFMLIENFKYWANNNVMHVEIYRAQNVERLEELQMFFIKRGYEGAMIRNPHSPYEHKRSKHLLKMKTFQDAEFPIIDCVPGKDNSVVFVCKTKDGTTFEATMSGDKKENQFYLKDKQLWKGEKLTVKFQGLTGKNKVPRFPVGLRIRYKE
jgi:ATP-dependent DNA ligase